MDSSVQTELEEQSSSNLSGQALSFFLHSLVALGSWMALMLLGYLIHPVGVPQLVILLLSAAVPLVVGFLIARVHPTEMATLVWLLGLVWFLIVCLWVLDMPTGPNQCFQCEATEKLTRTFFSLPRPADSLIMTVRSLALGPPSRSSATRLARSSAFGGQSNR